MDPLRHRLINGFTLLELLVTLALLGLLAAVAFPNFARVIEANRLVSATNEFQTALMYARSEAVRRNRSTVLTPLEDESWSPGWQVDQNEQPLRQWPRSNATVQITTGLDEIRFNSLGRFAPSSGTPAVRHIALGIGDQARCIRLEPSGLSRVLTPPQACPAP